MGSGNKFIAGTNLIFSPLHYTSEPTHFSLCTFSPCLFAVTHNPRVESKDRLLSMLPKILASISEVWRVSLPQHLDLPKVRRVLLFLTLQIATWFACSTQMEECTL